MQGLLIKLAVHTGCEARVTCNEADEMVRANAACMEGNGRTFALMIFAIQPIFFELTPDFVQRIVAPLLKLFAWLFVFRLIFPTIPEEAWWRIRAHDRYKARTNETR